PSLQSTCCAHTNIDLTGNMDQAAQVLEDVLATKQFDRRYGDVRRVITEELGYIYRYWLHRTPELTEIILARASHHMRAISNVRGYLLSANPPDSIRVSLAWEVMHLLLTFIFFCWIQNNHLLLYPSSHRLMQMMWTCMLLIRRAL